MAKRKRVALIYTYNENWIGGTYYIENLISALSQLPDSQQPELIIITSVIEDAERLQQNVTYAHWSFRRFERTLSLPERVVNKFSNVLLGKRVISLLHSDIDLVFPMLTVMRSYFERVSHHLYWIPDFQEHYLPAFFDADEIQLRKADQNLVLQLASSIVFSSYAAQRDFNTIYPGNALAQHVLQFAVTSRLLSEQKDTCLAKYGITRPYFICSNQFWKHKNHATVLRALAHLRLNYPQALVVFTGKEHDYRNPEYFKELMKLREELGLQNEVSFLGFISREDQLTLMGTALAVIQPSLFEGWSTVVEDAKSLNTPLLASNLDVHQEQLEKYEAKLYFAPEDSEGLAQCMGQSLKGHLPAQLYAYQHDIIRFAQSFMKTVNDITAN